MSLTLQDRINEALDGSAPSDANTTLLITELKNHPLGQLVIEAIILQNSNAFSGTDIPSPRESLKKIEDKKKREELFNLLIAVIELDNLKVQYEAAKEATNQAAKKIRDLGKQLGETISSPITLSQKIKDTLSEKNKERYEESESNFHEAKKTALRESEKLSELYDELKTAPDTEREGILRTIKDISQTLLESANTQLESLGILSAILSKIKPDGFPQEEKEKLESAISQIKALQEKITDLRNKLNDDSLNLQTRAQLETQLLATMEAQGEALKDGMATVKASTVLTKDEKRHLSKALSSHAKVTTETLDEISEAQKRLDALKKSTGDRQDFLRNHKNDWASHHTNNVGIVSEIGIWSPTSEDVKDYIEDHKDEYVTTKEGNIVFMNEDGNYYFYPDNDPDNTPQRVPADQTSYIFTQAWDTNNPKYFGNDTALNNYYKGFISNTWDNMWGGTDMKIASASAQRELSKAETQSSATAAVAIEESRSSPAEVAEALAADDEYSSAADEYDLPGNTNTSRQTPTADHGKNDGYDIDELADDIADTIVETYRNTLSWFTHKP